MSEFNGVMMQYFHWYNEPDGSLWNELADKAPALAAAGITAVWLPPPTKASLVATMSATAFTTSSTSANLTKKAQ